MKIWNHTRVFDQILNKARIVIRKALVERRVPTHLAADDRVIQSDGKGWLDFVTFG